MAADKKTWVQKNRKGKFKKGFNCWTCRKPPNTPTCAAAEDHAAENTEKNESTNLLSVEAGKSMYKKVVVEPSTGRYVISMGLTASPSVPSSSSSPVPCCSSSSSSGDDIDNNDAAAAVDDDEEIPSTSDVFIRRPFVEDMYMEQPTARGITQSKLRPKKREEETKSNRAEEESFHKDENGVLQMSKLTELYGTFLKHFGSDCKKPLPIVCCAERRGLCFILYCKCETCGFQSNPVKMFNECKTGSRGPASGEINEGLVMAAAKTKVGPTDLSFILACMNIKPLSQKTMYEKLNRLCDNMKELNETAMIKHQVFAKQYQETSGRSSTVAVETDTSFNNRIQAGYEAGTASFSPMLEQTTGFHLPLSAAIYNKICKNPYCKHTTNTCSRNFSTEESMSSSERKALVQNLENVRNENIVEISSVTTDASAQAEKVIEEYRSRSSETKLEHNLCFVHRLRTLQKNLKKVRMTNLPVMSKDRDAYMQKLSYCIRIRARHELVRVQSHFGERHFVTMSGRALRNILSCLSGDHVGCRTRSTACTAHLPSYSTSHLPLGQHLTLSDGDRRSLQDEICRTLSPAILAKLKTQRTTNRSETMHRRAFTYAPKNTVWSRNFPALCHSALHSSSYGTGRSTVILSESMNVHHSLDSPFSLAMNKRDARTVYDAKRTSTLEFKRKRYITRKQKCNKTMQQKHQQQNMS